MCFLLEYGFVYSSIRLKPQLFWVSREVHLIWDTISYFYEFYENKNKKEPLHIKCLFYDVSFKRFYIITRKFLVTLLWSHEIKKAKNIHI